MFPDCVKGPLLLLLAVAVSFLAFVGLVNGFIPGLHVAVSLGYSMCTDRYAYVDFVSLSNTSCSILPGDAVIIAALPPSPGDIACVSADTGMVCHRVVEVTDDGVYVVGDAAKWVGFFPWDAYYGVVVSKIPRSVSVPGVLLLSVFHLSPDAYFLLNSGAYRLF